MVRFGFKADVYVVNTLITICVKFANLVGEHKVGV